MKRAVLLILFIGWILLNVSNLPMIGVESADAGNSLLAMPSANANFDQKLLVPIGIVKKIALEKAQEMWGQVSPGEPIPCCDEDGNINAYMYPFSIGAPFPTYENIMKGVMEGRMMVKDIKEGFFDQNSAEVQSDSNSKSVARESGSEERDAGSNYESTSQGNLQGGSTPKIMGESDALTYQEAYKEAKNKELGIGEYGTVYVSARYDKYPIPLVSHYLSPFYTTGDLAKSNASKKMGSETAVLSRYYFLGHRGQYFEFVSGGEKTLVQAYSLDIESIKPVERAIPTTEQLEDIMRDWDSITGSEKAVKGGGS